MIPFLAKKRVRKGTYIQDFLSFSKKQDAHEHMQEYRQLYPIGQQNVTIKSAFCGMCS